MLTRGEVVKNCSAHLEFQPEKMCGTSDYAQAAEDVGPGQDATMAAAWAALEEAGIVSENVALSDYVNADADVIVYEELSDVEIFKSARSAATDSSGNLVRHVVPTVPTPVTASQVMDSLDVIGDFLAPVTTMLPCSSLQTVSSGDANDMPVKAVVAAGHVPWLANYCKRLDFLLKQNIFTANVHTEPKIPQNED
ncbi:hypothetical protein HPB51_024948 [Rhipicephalus microplus]|uniref:Tick transposon n=1 Tax=Rhipicephalus microplus TaxID=6941 RepID=A0A9J6DDG6_RHIMP|nr:hypothetical protein HPB51_024948 [Rhipicephalus microplus]